MIEVGYNMYVKIEMQVSCDTQVRHCWSSMVSSNTQTAWTL